MSTYARCTREKEKNNLNLLLHLHVDGDVVHETEEQTKEFRSIVYNYSSGNKVSYYDAVIYHESKEENHFFNILKKKLRLMMAL